MLRQYILPRHKAAFCAETHHPFIREWLKIQIIGVVPSVPWDHNLWFLFLFDWSWRVQDQIKIDSLLRLGGWMRWPVIVGAERGVVREIWPICGKHSEIMKGVMQSQPLLSIIFSYFAVFKQTTIRRGLIDLYLPVGRESLAVIMQGTRIVVWSGCLCGSDTIGKGDLPIILIT